MNKNQNILLRSCSLHTPKGKEETDILIVEGVIARKEPNIEATAATEIIDAKGLSVIPGLVDVHVHFRQPGYEYKETIYTGSRAAAAGGFTTVCTMPNLNPAPDSLEHLKVQLDAISEDSIIETIPYATITRLRMGAEMVDYAALAPYVAGFSDDGSGVQSEEVMRRAMEGIAPTGKVLAAHCEVNDLLRGGYIHDGEYCRAHGHRGICSESEWREIERNIRLSDETGCRLHICHISTKESVHLIREAKKSGIAVTCETGAHYLAFNDSELEEDGRFKMNPPIRSIKDQDALLEGVSDGTIDCIASDHAPHSAEEKTRGLEKSAMGVTGIELSLPAVYTYAVLPGHISFERMLDAMAYAPRRIFNIKGGMEVGNRADLAIVDFENRFVVNPAEFISKGKSTPFEGKTLQGKVITTIFAGNKVF